MIANQTKETPERRDETFKWEQGGVMKSQPKTRHQAGKKGNKSAEGRDGETRLVRASQMQLINLLCNVGGGFL